MIVTTLMIPVQIAEGLYSITAEVMSVYDGDTLTARTINGENVIVQFPCIDAPEIDQLGGKESAQRLRTILPKGTSIEIAIGAFASKDQQGRLMAVSFDSTSLQLVKEGQAWVHEPSRAWCYHRIMELRQAQSDARTQQIGLWSQPNPCPPWDYREKHCVTTMRLWWQL